jgi:hypothetical protein
MGQDSRLTLTSGCEFVELWVGMQRVDRGLGLLLARVRYPLGNDHRDHSFGSNEESPARPSLLL